MEIQYTQYNGNEGNAPYYMVGYVLERGGKTKTIKFVQEQPGSGVQRYRAVSSKKGHGNYYTLLDKYFSNNGQTYEEKLIAAIQYVIG